tara:strand:+ start:2012 stop:2296 length:285 start_codon:yes stop_codon:yes gene_type:complete
MSNSYIITAYGQIRPMPQPENEDGTFTLKQLQDAVGGLIEQLHPREPQQCPDKLVFLCDEEGLLKEKPYNGLASVLVGSSVVGDLVVIDEDKWS